MSNALLAPSPKDFRKGSPDHLCAICEHPRASHDPDDSGSPHVHLCEHSEGDDDEGCECSGFLEEDDILISPSQIKTSRECKRKWGWDKLTDGPERESTEAQQFGLDTHAVLEGWVGEGIKPVDGEEPDEVAKLAIQPDWIPLPRSPTAKVEKYFRYYIGQGVWLHGFIDVEDPALSTEWAIAIDYKTTVDLKWAMEEDDLARDAQGVIYSRVAARDDPWGRTKSLARWIYLQAKRTKKKIDGVEIIKRRPGKARLVEFLFDWKDTETLEEWDRVIKDAWELAGYRRQKGKISVLSLPYNPAACSSYGGCPNVEACALSKGEILNSYFAQEDREHGDADKNLTQWGSKTDNAPNAREGTEEKQKMGLLDKIKAKNKNKDAEAATADEKEPVAEAEVSAKPGGGILAKLQKKNDDKGVNPPGEDEGSEAIEPTSVEPAPAAKKKASKKKAGKKKATVKKTEAAPAPPPAETTEPEEETAPAEEGGLIVLVDCAPIKGFGKVTHQADLLAAINDEVREDRAHWSVPKNGEHYVDLRNAFTAVAAEALGKIKSGVLIVNSSTPEGTIILDAAIAAGTMVIQGTR